MTEVPFNCRVCGSRHYKVHLMENEEEYYSCRICSVRFEDPDNFSIPKIKFVMLDRGSMEPEKNKENDAGHDLFASKASIVRPGETVMVHTGIAIELPAVYEAQVRARSGLAKKQGIQVANGPGTIDNGYRNTIGVLLYNTSDQDFFVEEGDRIAQLVVKHSPQVEFELVDKLSETDRGLSGFGESGTSGKIEREKINNLS